jgi:hypothetical protein
MTADLSRWLKIRAQVLKLIADSLEASRNFPERSEELHPDGTGLRRRN